MIDQREVRHLIRQNKKIKEKIAEQARVYKEERHKLKFVNRSLQKTLEEERQKNQSTIEEFNAQIIALEAELRRVKANEPEVTIYTTPNSRPIKQISFAQLEAESKRLAEETNRIIQQSQKPSPSIFTSSSPNKSNNPYQTSSFSNVQSYRTRYQFNLTNNNNTNGNNFNFSLQQQQQQYQNQYDYSKTQPPMPAQNNTNNPIPNQQNQNMYQANQEIPQKNPAVPNQQLNSNTFPLASNQSSKELLNQIIEEEEEEKELSQNIQKNNSQNNSLSDDTIPADDNVSTVKNSTSDSINRNDQKNQMQSQQNTSGNSGKSQSSVISQSQQNISQNSGKSQSSTISQSQQNISQNSGKSQSSTIIQSQQNISQNSGKSQSSAISKAKSSSSEDLINTPKPSPQKTVSVKNQNEAPTSSQSQNVASNNDINQQNKAGQKAATSPSVPIIINEDSQNSEDPFAENFMNDDEFPDEASKSIDQQQQQQQQQKDPPKQEKPQQQQQQQQKPLPKNSPKKDPFVNENMSGIFDDISFNHDAFGSELDMQAAFDAPSISLSKKDDNSKDQNNDKDKKSSNKQETKKDDKDDDIDDLHVPSANSWSFPSSQIQIEGFD